MEPTFFLEGSQLVQKSLIALSQTIHTKAVQNFHVSIALFDSGVRGDNRVYPELVNVLIEKM